MRLRHAPPHVLAALAGAVLLGGCADRSAVEVVLGALGEIPFVDWT